MAVECEISFVLVSEKDLPVLFEWLRKPHVARWWYPDVLPWEEFETKYKKNLASKDVESYLIAIGQKRIGFIQAYEARNPPGEESVPYSETTWGMDLYIALPEFLGKGLGSKIIKAFMKKLIMEHRVRRFIIDPQPENQIAIKTYEKVGFKKIKITEQPYGKVLLMEKLVRS